jgi:hypothetical protein
MELEDEPMMGGHPSAEGLDQVRPRGLQPPRRQVGQPLGIALAGHEGLEDRPPTHAEDVADHLPQFDVGVFQGLLQAERVARDLAHQLLPRAGEVAQVLDAPAGRSCSESGPTPAGR